VNEQNVMRQGVDMNDNDFINVFELVSFELYSVRLSWLT